MSADTDRHPEETVIPQRVSCFRCRFYDRVERRCRLGKVNPQSKLDTYDTAQVLGIRALCAFNLYRDQLLSLPPGDMKRPSVCSAG